MRGASHSRSPAEGSDKYRHHLRFDGEIVVIHDGLSGEACAVLAATSDAVRFAPVPSALRERAERLRAALAPLPMHPAQFWMFEAFRLAGAAKLLLCDGDLLFRAAAIRAREGVDLHRAKVLHFNTPAKPWQPDAMLRGIRGCWSRPEVTAFRLWYEATSRR